MARLSWVTFVCLLAVPAGALALIEGCSSSSSPAAPQAEAGASETSTVAEASAEGAASDGAIPIPDGGNISLTWGTALVTGAGALRGDGGPDASPDGGDAGAIADAASDGGGTIDSGTATDSGAATDSAATTESGEDAGNFNGEDGGPPAVPGAQVCAFPFSAVQALGSWTAPPQSSALSCVTTAADGTFVISSVPVRTNLVLIVTKTGFIPVVLSIQTASSPMDVRQYPIFMYETSTEVNPAASIMVDWQNKGQIVVFDVGLGDGGASVAMGTQDDASAPNGIGPVYEDSNGDFVPAATMFYPAAGTLGLSLAQYFNVAAGVYTLTMKDMADDCEPSLMPL